MQTAEHWNECWHCNPKKFAQAYSPQDCPCKCHVSPTPDSMDETDPQWLKDNGFPELSKALEAIQHHSPTPTDSWVDDFNKKFILNQQDPLRLTSPSWQEWKEIKSFILEVRQKAYDEGYEQGRSDQRYGLSKDDGTEL